MVLRETWMIASILVALTATGSAQAQRNPLDNIDVGTQRIDSAYAFLQMASVCSTAVHESSRDLVTEEMIAFERERIAQQYADIPETIRDRIWEQEQVKLQQSSFFRTRNERSDYRAGNPFEMCTTLADWIGRRMIEAQMRMVPTTQIRPPVKAATGGRP